MKEKAIYEFKVPSFLMVGIFNADISGYEDEDIELDDEFYTAINKHNYHPYQKLNLNTKLTVNALYNELENGKNFDAVKKNHSVLKK